MESKDFHLMLRQKMDRYVHEVYAKTKPFPKEELYGVTSQIRRASLSVILNYIEGYARGKGKVNGNFIEISYGSLQESKYLLEFCFKEQYLNAGSYEKCLKMADEIGAILWTIINSNQ